MSNVLDDGWIRIPKRSPKTQFEKYQTGLWVIVSRTKSGARIYLTRKVLEMLDNPTFIAVRRKKGSSSLALEAVAGPEEDGFRVVTSAGGGKNKTHATTPCINVSSIAKTYDLKSGAYDAYERHGMIVFDSADTPSQI